MTAPQASIIITTHNRPDKLRRAIASACAASTNAEVIVVDDASTDETGELCASIEGIKYVRVERNQGVAGARNVGLIASCGQFINFLDDDDFRLPNSVDDQINQLTKSPAAMLCYAQAIPEDENDKQGPPFPLACPQGDIFWQLLTRNFVPCGSVLFRRKCLIRVGLLDDSINRIDDWDLWLRIAELFPVISLDAPVLIWRQPTRDSSQGSSDTVEVINLAISHFRKTCSQLPRVQNASKVERQKVWRAFSLNLAEHLAWEAFRSICGGQLRRAFVSGRTLLRLHPSTLMHLSGRWTRLSTVKSFRTNGLRRDNLETAKRQLKEIRSAPDHR